MSTERKARLHELQQKARQLAAECRDIGTDMNDGPRELWHRKVTAPVEAVNAFILGLQNKASLMEGGEKPDAPFLL